MRKKNPTKNTTKKPEITLANARKNLSTTHSLFHCILHMSRILCFWSSHQIKNQIFHSQCWGHLGIKYACLESFFFRIKHFFQEASKVSKKKISFLTGRKLPLLRYSRSKPLLIANLGGVRIKLCSLRLKKLIYISCKLRNKRLKPHTFREWISFTYSGSRNSDIPSSRIPFLVTLKFPIPSYNQ